MTFLEFLGILFIIEIVANFCRFIKQEYTKYKENPDAYAKKSETSKSTETAEYTVDVNGNKLPENAIPAKLEVYKDTKTDLTYYILYRLDNWFVAQGFTPDELVSNVRNRFPNIVFGVCETFNTER